jgi:hypothetical protein
MMAIRSPRAATNGQADVKKADISSTEYARIPVLRMARTLKPAVDAPFGLAEAPAGRISHDSRQR